MKVKFFSSEKPCGFNRFINDLLDTFDEKTLETYNNWVKENDGDRELVNMEDFHNHIDFIQKEFIKTLLRGGKIRMCGKTFQVKFEEEE